MSVHTLPELDYPYDALEPYIDTKTMEIHHTKHHQAYVTNLVNAVKGLSEIEERPVEWLIANLDSVPDSVRIAVRNNGGGHLNHSFFWETLKKGVEPSGDAFEALKKRFGNYEEFKAEFKKAALGRFGSGWAWLVLADGELAIESTPNQDSPVSRGRIPIIGLDVWEHAYYLKYQNRRADYVDAFFNVLNWEKVNEHYLAAVR